MRKKQLNKMTRGLLEGFRRRAVSIGLGGGMAFRQCESCEGLIASRATTCPHCDIALAETELVMPSPTRVSGFGNWTALLFFMIAVVMLAEATGLIN